MQSDSQPHSTPDSAPDESQPTQLRRESFIPLNRRDLIDLCLCDRILSDQDAQQFGQFCDILSAYFHFQFHGNLEAIKENYAPFNPNVDVQSRSPHTQVQLDEMKASLIQDFRHLLEKSNYLELSKRTLKRAMEERSLIPLQTDVDFDDFQQLICYYRGDINEEVEVKGLLGRAKNRTINIFERVVLLIQFKPEPYFKKQGIDPSTLDYIPGKIYLYFYKNVPKYDLELLFPNVKTSMTWKDRLMLWVPAVGAGVGIMIKVLPQLLLLAGSLFLIFDGDRSQLPEPVQQQIENREQEKAEEQAQENPQKNTQGNDGGGDRSLLPESIQQETQKLTQGNEEVIAALITTLVTTLSLVVVLGGFVARQYTNYKNKKIQFQKHITETLFFRNMANHAAVFQLLVDVAEEEECKEVILAYYHLLISPTPLSADELDRAVEVWLQQKLEMDVDFDMPDALNKLTRLRETLDDDSDNLCALVEPDPNPSFGQPKQYRARSLSQAKQIIDRLWDNAFRYS